MYVSTRSRSKKFASAQAIALGLANDGGLFVPEEIELVDKSFLSSLISSNYSQRAVAILQKFLTDYSPEELLGCVQQAYRQDKFPGESPAPVVSINSNLHILELWHGPTQAFKDMALQLLPPLLSQALHQQKINEEIIILVATSGDTGKAALEGFRDVPGMRVIVFYPYGGVSEIQRLQMITQEGCNVHVVGVRGNFDDAQTGVKQIFNDQELAEVLAEHKFRFSSANSINWGRLVPQIVYYFSAYADLMKKNFINVGEKINFVVPTGNFGNILAGYYAKMMGLPVGKLICASNANNVLTDFLQSGHYNRNRNFYKTISPSMDILVSSNLERLLYHITDGDSQAVSGWMESLAKQGEYRIDTKSLQKIQSVFWAGHCNDEKTIQQIAEVYRDNGYVCDPHTAVAWAVYDNYRCCSGDSTPTVLVSTASPFKFNESVLKALNGMITSINSEFEALQELAIETGWPIPTPMLELQNKSVIHTAVCDKLQMKHKVEAILGL